MKSKFIPFLMFVVLLLSLSSVVASDDGFFVLSGGKVDYVSNDPLLNGNAWSVTVVQNGAGQSVVGTFAPKDVIDGADGVTTQYPLTVSSTLVSESVSWNIKRATYNSYEYSGVRINTLLYPLKSLSTIGQEKCYDVYGSKAMDGIVGWSKRGWTSDMYCYYASKRIPVGELSADKTKSFESKFTAVVNGQSVSGTLTDQQTNVWLGNKVNVAFVGGVSSLYDVSNPSQLAFVFPDNVWKPVDSTLLAGVKSAESTMLSCLETLNTKYEECMTPYTNALNQNLGYKTVSIDGGGVAKITGGLSDGKYTIPMNTLKPVVYPLINLRIDADWIGVVRMVGMPDIVALGTEKTVMTGNVFNEKVTVKNIGGFQGVFDVYATCTSPLSSTGKVRTSALQSGQQQDIFVTITGSTTKDTTSGCVFTASDVNNGANKDTMSKSYVVKTIPTCVPDAFRCNGNVIEKCQADGSNYVTVSNCPTGCTYDKSGNPVCSLTPFVCKTDGECKTGETCTSGVCVPKGELECKSSFLGLVPASVGVKESCNFWCSVGLKSKENVNVCVKDYTPLFLVVFVVLVVLGIAVFSRNKGKKKGKGGSRAGVSGSGEVFPFWKNKWFWIVLAVLVGIAIFLSLIKYFIWAFVGFFVLAIIIKWLFGVNLFKVIFRGG